MSRYKHGLIVAIALLTVVGMTAVFAAPTGAAITSGDGVTTAFDSVSSVSADSGENDSDDHPACDNPGEADNNSAKCTDKEEDDEEDDDDEEEDEEGGDDVAGTCETGGAAQNNTFANEAFGTENESGPISSEIHANEEQFQDAEPLVHEVSCGVATIDNNAAGNDSDDGGDGNESNPAEDLLDELEDNAPGGDDGNESDDGDDGNESNPAEDLLDELEDNAPGGDDGNESDDGDEGEDGEAGTCETGGAAQENTVANEAFGTQEEEGPISSEIHANEEQFQDGEPLAHEVSCGVATVDNNAP